MGKKYPVLNKEIYNKGINMVIWDDKVIELSRNRSKNPR
jgi:hypothetical protein